MQRRLRAWVATRTIPCKNDVGSHPRWEGGVGMKRTQKDEGRRDDGDMQMAERLEWRRKNINVDPRLTVAGKGVKTSG